MISFANIGASGIYVLVNNITYSGAAKDFSGIFYGSGYTITQSGGNGLFGTVSGGAVIRDLTVNVSSGGTGGSAPYTAGGIATALNGTSAILNCTVGGSGAVGGVVSGTGGGIVANVGGIAGTMEGTAKIQNCRVTLAVTLTAANPTIGGVVGSISAGGNASTANISLVTAANTVTASGTGSERGNLRVGGLVGYTASVGKIEDCVFSGEVKMPSASSSRGRPGDINTYVVNCGGLIGSMKDGVLDGCNFAGTIAIPNTFKSDSIVIIGGLVANVGATPGNQMHQTSLGTGENTAPIKIQYCTVTGDIDFKDEGDGHFFIGGITGLASGNDSTNTITFTDCEYSAGGKITVTKPNLYLGSFDTNEGGALGGFTGSGPMYVNFTDCRVFADSITAEIYSGTVGGFSGVLSGNLANCYTNTAIDVTYTGPVKTEDNIYMVGGLAGQIASFRRRITNCYALGPVNVTANLGSAPEGKLHGVRAGGFAGNLGKGIASSNRQIEFSNCYAAGNVTVTNTASGGLAYAGGFAGFMVLEGGVAYSWLEKSYAAGEVKATAGSGGMAYAGGIVGYLEDGMLRYCAATGASVQATGGSTNGAGRIWGGKSAAATSVGENNYGNAEMYVGTAAPAKTTSDTGTDLNGFNTAYSNFANAYWWRTAGPVFSDTAWDLSIATIKYRPVLRHSITGAVMGGQ
jgi:hypothetical protein